jgi:hypothetical protein
MRHERGKRRSDFEKAVEQSRMSRLGARAEVMPRLKRQEQHICKTLTDTCLVSRQDFFRQNGHECQKQKQEQTRRVMVGKK